MLKDCPLLWADALCEEPIPDFQCLGVPTTPLTLPYGASRRGPNAILGGGHRLLVAQSISTNGARTLLGALLSTSKALVTTSFLLLLVRHLLLLAWHLLLLVNKKHRVELYGATSPHIFAMAAQRRSPGQPGKDCEVASGNPR